MDLTRRRKSALSHSSPSPGSVKNSALFSGCCGPSGKNIREEDQDQRQRGAGIKPEKAGRGMAQVAPPLHQRGLRANSGQTQKAETQHKFKHAVDLALGPAQSKSQPVQRFTFRTFASRDFTAYLRLRTLRHRFSSRLLPS